MNKKICVYTCITGEYDDLIEIECPEKAIDYYCFTNNKGLKSKTWKIVQIDDNSLDNCRLARKIKILGHPILDKYDIAVWSDADVVWQKPISSFVNTYLKSGCFSIFKHHIRNKIYDEAITCLRLDKEQKSNIASILHFYSEVGYPDDNGLCESTVFIKKIHDSKVIETMNAWFDMVKKYSKRDQLSFNYAAWKTNLKVSYISQNVWNNSWFYTNKHNSSANKITNCHVYYGDPDSNFDMNKYFIYDYKKNGEAYSFNAVIPVDAKEIEFAPVRSARVTFKNISVKPDPRDIMVFGTNSSIFCNNHGTIRAYGNFKEGEKLSFSITMHYSTPAEIDKLIENQWAENNALNGTISNLEEELNNIKSSRSWKIISKTFGFLHKKQH